MSYIEIRCKDCGRYIDTVLDAVSDSQYVLKAQTCTCTNDAIDSFEGEIKELKDKLEKATEALEKKFDIFIDELKPDPS